MAITHPFVSAVADGSDATLVRPSNWNADHTIADDTITAAMMAASSVDLATNTVTGILPTANGGTGIAFFTAAGPTVARVYTFPDSAATILYSGGALGTPSSGTATNLTGLPVSTGISGLGTGVATFLATPSSANLAAAVTGETGSGALVFATSPALVTPDIGTPSAGVLTSCTGLPVAGLANGTDGELITWSATGVAATVATGSSGQVLTSNGAGAAPTFQAAGGGATLDGITAATADEAGIANADWNVRWNWAKTTDSEQAFRFSESAAATGGTSTSGIPNQVLLYVDTLAASTMSPLSVYSRGSHVFSVSPTAAMILASSNNPAYSFAANTTVGMSLGLSGVILAAEGGNIAAFNQGNSTPQLMHYQTTLNFARPGYTEASNAITGMTLNSGAPGTVGIGNGGVENARFSSTTTAGSQNFFQVSNAGAVTTGYAIDARKSRGSTASPTVITTGDDLLTLSGYGYVGATNTYQEACRITFDSTGTIADTATGIGGIMRFSVAKVGAEPAEILALIAGTTTGGGWAVMDEADANPTTTELDDGDAVAVYIKAGNITFAQNVAGTINFLYCPIDGSTVTWVANTTGP